MRGQTAVYTVVSFDFSFAPLFYFISLSIRPSQGARGEEILDGGETPDTQLYCICSATGLLL